jgi:ribosomal protein L7Ae-like RNA K-turn-binding protein
MEEQSNTIKQPQGHLLVCEDKETKEVTIRLANHPLDLEGSIELSVGVDNMEALGNALDNMKKVVATMEEMLARDSMRTLL